MSDVSPEHRQIADDLVLKWAEKRAPIGDLVIEIGDALQAAYERGVSAAPSTNALVEFERRAKEHENHNPYWSPTSACPFCCAMQVTVPRDR
jgi:hypothetical protein